MGEEEHQNCKQPITVRKTTAEVFTKTTPHHMLDWAGLTLTKASGDETGLNNGEKTGSKYGDKMG